MVLRRIGILSLGKVMGAMYVLIGLIAGLFFALLSLAGMQPPPDQAGAQVPGMLFGVGAIIFLPIFYGIMGFIGGIICAAIYNLIAGIVGGLELDLEPAAQM